ncbi:MAG: cobalt ECF transporter T component CbiQ [Spirulina sp. SIO3F2]|nr:cobalt ECF transporter T component CbiQ [Spirulina sp. SIO3F2]
MPLAIDRYAHLNSPIHRWELRTKFVGFLAIMMVCGTLQHPILLGAIALLTAGLYALSRLPRPFLWAYWRYPGTLIGIVLLLTPWLVGDTVIWQWGPLQLTQEGLLRVVQIAVRFLCLVTLSVVLLGTAPLARSLRTLQSLGVPSLLVDMALLTYRYLQVCDRNRRTMQNAMRLRGFEPQKFSRRNLRLWALLAGNLLVRSYDQSIRVYQAMLLRGYGQRAQAGQRQQGSIGMSSWLGLMGMVAIAMGLAIAQLRLV